MSVQTDAPPVADVSRETSVDERPLFIDPSSADRAPRKAEPPRAMPHDPEAPHGYMVDPVTKEVRPRKTAGRQAARKTAAPRKRPANRPRVASKAPAPADPTKAPAPAPVDVPTHAEQVMSICGGLWMLGASLPMPEPNRRVMGVNTRNLTVRVKAQAHVIGHNREALAQHVGQMADRIPAVARGVEWLTDENGWGWMLPTMFALIPFVAQSQAAWREPVAQLVPLAHAVDAQFAQMMGAPPAADVSRETSGGLLPDEVPLPGMGA